MVSSTMHWCHSWKSAMRLSRCMSTALLHAMPPSAPSISLSEHTHEAATSALWSCSMSYS